jgi:hypothetical protein
MGMNIGAIIRDMEERQGRLDVDLLPTPDEFFELSRMFSAGTLTGAVLSAEQCKMLATTFRTLSVSIIATEKLDG